MHISLPRFRLQLLARSGIPFEQLAVYSYRIAHLGPALCPGLPSPPRPPTLWPHISPASLQASVACWTRQRRVGGGSHQGSGRETL